MQTPINTTGSRHPQDDPDLYARTYAELRNAGASDQIADLAARDLESACRLNHAAFGLIDNLFCPTGEG